MDSRCLPRASDAIRIGIDHRGAHVSHGGIAVYVRELTRALTRDFPDDHFALYEHTVRKSRAAPRANGHVTATGRRLLPAVRGRMGRPVERVLGPIDVLHLPDWALLRSDAPIVATIHDVLFETLPDCYPEPLRIRLRDATKALLARASHVVVPGTRARDEVATHFGFAPERIHVTPLGARALPQARRTPEGPPTVLSVGTFMARKNHARLLAAFDALAMPDVRLVFAGGRAMGDEALVSAASEHPHVDVVLSPDDAALAQAYADADVVALPSRGEGFGLPVVEALAMGKPLLVGADTTCQDVAGDCALAVDPLDVEAIADGLRRLLTDDALRARLAAAGPARAAEFTWARTAKATRAVYEMAVA